MSKWLDSSANKIRQTYVNGFLDISGGSISMRNNNPIHFYNASDSTVPTFSIKSDVMSITNADGILTDLSLSKLLSMTDISGNLNLMLEELLGRTHLLSSDNQELNLLAYINQDNEIMYDPGLGNPDPQFASSIMGGADKDGFITLRSY